MNKKATERNKKCIICEGVFYNPYGVGIKQWNKRKYCSYKCRDKATSKYNLNRKEEDHPRWKGDNVGYFGVHDWITKHYGQPCECENCGLKDDERKYHWANISGKYKRDRNDFMRMCVPCHRKYDYARN